MVRIMKEKLKAIWFTLLVVGTLFQTTLTFYLLYKKSENETLNKIIFVLLLAYVLAFLVIVAMSLGSKKISRDAMVGYKRSRKTIKRVLTLLMLVLSVINIFNSRGGGAEMVLSVAMIIYNLVLIYIDIKITKIKDGFARKRKQRERAAREAEIKTYRIGDKRERNEKNG